ncbi:hypothetical protein MTsPCn9_34260 [Croceitalea sp. MTPC9]|uniref:conjugative transposon protein TraM n=1 Tax=unclassified Croceitalea TaxID=2632280 RepID=UPI002B3F65EA|nr:hypothetical protein MTsPCn6_34690 [Croceitalea sp. MTPC6]GMN18486.1 hypothetical protein MTsPCn9_34260 [Croceitalea sp. MTPC9]
MENFIEKIKQLEAPQIIVSLMMLGCAVFIGYGVFKPSEEEAKGKSTEILEFPDANKSTENYNSKLEAYELKEEKESSLELKFDNSLFKDDKDNSDSDVYAQEEDERVKELQRQIALMEEKRRNFQSNDSNSGNGNQSANTQSKTAREPKQKTKEQLEMEALQAELDYYELLKQSKEEMTSGNTRAEITSNGALEPFRASIYRDQFILPGDRVKLLLNEDVELNGKLFKRNTTVYATANINKSRVLLNVDNINHVPLSLEIRDIDDGGVGLYNKRAGELWREFQSEVQEDGVQDIGQEISQEVTVPIVGTAIRAFGNFFRKRRYKERDKILLVNDHQVLVSPITN